MKSEERNPFAVRRLASYRPPHITPRIPGQRSVFTIQADPTEDVSRSSAINRWAIGRDICAEIKRVLDAVGFNQSTLFPDLEGLSEYAGWRYKWGKFR
jgi:hypothetical protein